MRQKYLLKYFFFVLIHLCLISILAGSEDINISEEIIFGPTQTVVTPSRTTQTIDQAPATVTVITSKEIEASGALSIFELLRFVPGLDVMTISASQVEINARGLNEVPSNKMLVMIDGRSVYYDYYGGIVWENLPVAIEQIDRIEIMRSPGSALYGANAFSGVINIITKRPGQITNRHIKYCVGENSTINSNFLLGGIKGHTGIRVAGGYKMTDSFNNPDDKSEEVVIGNISLEHLFQNNTRLLVDAGLSSGYVHKIFINRLNKSKAFNTYTKLNLERDDLLIQAFWNHGDQEEATFYLPVKGENIVSNTYDLEIQNTFNLSMNNSLIYGANYRLNTIKSSILDRKHTQNLFAIFLQDEYRPIPEITLLAGTRVDWHPLVGTNSSPRASIIYSPRKHHTFRLSASKAYRNPSFLNSYLYYETPELIRLKGSKELSSENIYSYEISYLFLPDKTYRFEINAFYLRYKDHIVFMEPDVIDRYPYISFNNKGNARVSGFETSFELVPLNFIKLSMNYSFKNTKNRYTILAKQYSPKHKVNFKTFLSLPFNLTASIYASYIGKSQWEIPKRLGFYDLQKAKQHFRLDSKISYKSKKYDFELFIAAYNLLDKNSIEYPIAEKTERRITSGIYWFF